MLLTSLVISCVSKAPKPPAVEFYLHDLPRGVALCSPSDGGICPAVPMSVTDGWYMLKPRGVQAIQDYIDELVCIIDGGCQGAGIESNKKSLKEYAEDFRYIQIDLESKRMR